MTEEFTPTLWRHLESRHPELNLAHDEVKRRFWSIQAGIKSESLVGEFIDVTPDVLANEVAERAAQRPGMIKEHREGDKELEYDTMLVGKMERTCPQFNLRNVARAILEIDMEWTEWGKIELPDRHGFEADLEEVRTARVEPPVFLTEEYSSLANRALQEDLFEVFFGNDWEQWYGEDKKRAMGAMWLYKPEDGGKRTRPWPDIQITEHKYWKGRLITEEF